MKRITPTYKETLLSLGCFISLTLPVLLFDQTGKNIYHAAITFGCLLGSGIVLWIIGMLMASTCESEKEK